jgi:hypothetical protein
MGKQKLSEIFLFMTGLNITVGAAAAKLDMAYLFAGVVTGTIFYYLRYVLRSEGKSLLNKFLNAAARALDK